MLEIELKFRAADWDRPRSIISTWAPRPPETHAEADHYFNAPDRDFAATNEAFRVRVTDGRSVLTYKGPRRPGAAKTRLEIEVPLAAGEQPTADAVRLFTALGYRPVAVVNKTREMFRFVRDGFDMAACFDDVAQVGRFIELEVVAVESSAAAAEAAVLAAAAELGLTDVEPRSYLRMLLTR